MSRVRTAAAVVLLATAGGAAALAQPASAPGAPPQAPADVVIAREEARSTALDLAARLAEGYVFPDVAQRYAAMLRGNVESGAYDGFTSARALAERLTADLRAVSPDNHLRVGLRPPGAGPRPGGPGAGPGLRPRFPFEPIEEARLLAPGIAYIRFNLFPGDPETVAAVERFMTEHADARALIIDARTHRGGGLAEMDAMFPYLFGRPTTLVTMDTRASVDRARGDAPGDERLRLVPANGEVVRREHYVEPHPTERRLHDAAVFVLTSGGTASAAEHLTLALKRTGRATVIGEPTAGAGHYGGMRPIGERFAAFIPVGRTFDPDNNDDWEGDGVAPDVAVPAAAALAEALVRAGIDRAEADRIAAGVTPSQPMERRRPRTAS